MPTELLQEFIGKPCVISMVNELTAYDATIIAVQENWIKIENKKMICLVNGDMIRDIKLKK